MPLLWKIKPEIKVYFVGAGAPERLKNFQDDRVMVTGFVESLVPYMKKAQIFISPIFFGSGTKTKVLEAMGMGKLVVGTKDSFTGILCTDGHDCLVIDPPRDMELWITKIIDVLEGKDEISKLENNARETIEKFHDWNVNKLNYVKEYRELL
jgi:glycosyltransferase involved in cell wall biosynthesis